MTAAMHYRRAPGAAAALVDGETVVVSPADFRYHWLNSTATAVWDLLADSAQVDDIVLALTERFEVDEVTCRSDTEACLENFFAIGIAAPVG